MRYLKENNFIPVPTSLKTHATHSDLTNNSACSTSENFKSPAPLNNKQLAQQILGKVSSPPLDFSSMNKIEKKYYKFLSNKLEMREIKAFSFEAEKLKLAPATYYTPDFRVVNLNDTIEFHEVKGYWRDDAKVKIKVASSMHPYKFIAVYRKKINGKQKWIFESF